ncbi:hypothetical protein K438DRAFT_988455 [Mycena galopus ATCC 62051]|nr:hypothetical protein K438DRAFT_988455 [Mycena galopus ATCC 62051]
MATEVPNQALSIARPGVRQETRTKIIEILAGTANGCLHELGYTPGLLEKLRYLEEQGRSLTAANELLVKENETLKGLAQNAQKIQETVTRYQEENVKMYEDNGKLVQDCKLLRGEIAKLRNQVLVNEEMRGKDVPEILKQYALLKTHYEEAIMEIQKFVKQRPAGTLASGSHPPRQLQQSPPVVVPSQQLRRVSGPQLQGHSPQSFAPQTHGAAPQLQTNIFSPQAHPQPQPYPQAQPYRVLPVHSNPQQQQPNPMGIVPNFPSHRQNGPLGWIPQQSTSPTSATYVPPPGYGTYAVSGGMGIGVAGPSSHYRPSSGGGASMGHRTPTTAFTPPTAFAPPTFPPTPPMSELQLNLQNFTSPAMAHAHPQGQAQVQQQFQHPQQHPQHQHPQQRPQQHAHPHPGLLRTSSSASGSSARRTPAGPQSQSPVQPPGPAAPTMMILPPPARPRSPAAFVTRDGHMALPPERRVSMEMQVDRGETPVPRFSQPRVDRPQEPQANNVPETQVQPGPPETQMDVAPQMEEGSAPPELLDAASPPELHEAITPPLDASSTFPVAVAADAASPADGGGDVPRLKEEEEEDAPVVKMEVDGGEEEGEEEDDGNEEDFIELDADGLRTVADCAAAVFDAERNYICRFCESRHAADLESGVASEPPPEFPDATLEERAAHCETEHDHVWNILRHNVDE